jgi:CRISPR-associated protein Csm5
MYVFDTNDFLKSLDNEKSLEFCKLADNATNPIPIFRFFRDNFDKNKVKYREVKASNDLFERYKEICNSSSFGRDAINQFELKRNIFNPIKNVPYIPGSSLKGCLKTFWMSEANRKSDKPYTRNPEDAPYKGEIGKVEESILKGSFSTDPFRFVKVSDLYPVEKDDTYLSRIMYAVMFPRNTSKEQDADKLDKRASLTVALEVIPKGNIFEGVISIDDQQYLPEDAKIQKISMKALMLRSKGYYITNQKVKSKNGTETEVLSKTFSEYKLLEKQGAFGFNCSKELMERIGKDCFPVRLGHHSSAEFITIDGCRSVKITPPPVKQAKYAERATTIWLASSKKKPDTAKGLQSFGWAMLEFEEIK